MPQTLCFVYLPSISAGWQGRPYVALGLVFVQHLLHLQIQRSVIRRQAPTGPYVRGFADAEFPAAERTVARFSIR